MSFYYDRFEPVTWALAAQKKRVKISNTVPLTLSGLAVTCLTLSGQSAVWSIFNLDQAIRHLLNLVRDGGRRPITAYSTLSRPAVAISNVSSLAVAYLLNLVRVGNHLLNLVRVGPRLLTWAGSCLF